MSMASRWSIGLIALLCITRAEALTSIETQSLHLPPLYRDWYDVANFVSPTNWNVFVTHNADAASLDLAVDGGTLDVTESATSASPGATYMEQVSTYGTKMYEDIYGLAVVATKIKVAVSESVHIGAGVRIMRKGASCSCYYSSGDQEVSSSPSGKWVNVTVSDMSQYARVHAEMNVVGSPPQAAECTSCSSSMAEFLKESLIACGHQCDFRMWSGFFSRLSVSGATTETRIFEVLELRSTVAYSKKEEPAGLSFDCPHNTKCFELNVSQVIGFPDGVKRTLTVANRQLPGPSIVVTEGDRVMVRLNNEMDSDTTSVHWHGMHQRGTPYADGVPYITQLPILPNTYYDYKFVASPAGTHWWHSHSGAQYADGLFGPLIVRPKEEPTTDSDRVVDDEFVVLLTEWFHRDSVDVLSELEEDYFREAIYFPTYTSGLINGMGSYNCSAYAFDPTGYEPNPNEADCRTIHDPVFRVVSGSRYRVRIIGATSGSTFVFSVHGHKMTVVAMDGIEVEPKEVDHIAVYVAQRYDVILIADQTPGVYGMYATTFQGVDNGDGSEQIRAQLVYDNVTPVQDVGPELIVCQQPNCLLSTSQLEPLEPLGNIAEMAPDKTLTISLYCSRFDYVCYFYNTSFAVTTDTPLLLSAYRNSNELTDLVTDLPYNEYSEDRPTPVANIFGIDNGDIVRIILNNVGDQSHPFHLHGYEFVVLGNGEKGSGPYTGQSLRTTPECPYRDTEQMEEQSWMVLQFEANNPGVWFFHCHIDWHLDAGLAMAFYERPGNSSSFPAPPSDYPIIVRSHAGHVSVSLSLLFLGFFAWLSD